MVDTDVQYEDAQQPLLCTFVFVFVFVLFIDNFNDMSQDQNTREEQTFYKSCKALPFVKFIKLFVFECRSVQNCDTELAFTVLFGSAFQ